MLRLCCACVVGFDSSLKPVIPNRKLHSIHPGIRRSQAGVGNMLVSRARRKRSLATVKKMQAKRSVGEEIGGGSKGRNLGIGEQHSAAYFKIWDHTAGRGKVPFQIQRVES